MVKDYITTIRATLNNWKFLNRYFLENDCKKWVIGLERGRTGYWHFQVRFAVSRKYEEVHEVFGNAHLEEGNPQADWRYETKDGHYLQSWDTPQMRQCRFGQLRNAQKAFINAVKTQNDREVDVWFDKEGNAGKSWLCNAMWERHQAYYTPPTLRSAEAIGKWVCAGYRDEGIILIDIPRSFKWTEQEYVGIEQIKDGLITDDRYTAKTRNIRGVKLGILCNTMPKVGKLSVDRWRIHTTEELNDGTLS